MNRILQVGKHFKKCKKNSLEKLKIGFLHGEK